MLVDRETLEAMFQMSPEQSYILLATALIVLFMAILCSLAPRD